MPRPILRQTLYRFAQSATKWPTDATEILFQFQNCELAFRGTAQQCLRPGMQEPTADHNNHSRSPHSPCIVAAHDALRSAGLNISTLTRRSMSRSANGLPQKARASVAFASAAARRVLLPCTDEIRVAHSPFVLFLSSSGGRYSVPRLLPY
jgi:hypothetical protein